MQFEAQVMLGLAALAAIAVCLAAVHGAAEETAMPLHWGPRLTWPETDGPQAREHAATIADEEGDRVLLIGGSGYNPYQSPLGDVWELNLKTNKWRRLRPSGSVPTGGSRRVAQIPNKRAAYLFGGYDGASRPNNELYRVDYDQEIPKFTAIPQESPPAPRFLHGFVYDPVPDRFFLFGGIGAEVLNDTWTMSIESGRAHWRKLPVEPAPSARYGFFYGFDPQHGRVVLFSGAQKDTPPIDPARDTWALDTRSDPARWRLLSGADDRDAPSGRRNGCGIFDLRRQRLFVFGGTADLRTSEAGLFMLDTHAQNVAWKRLDLEGAPPLRSSGFGFYDARRGRVVMGFGNTTEEVFRDLTSLGE